jgi:hypothetical protein
MSHPFVDRLIYANIRNFSIPQLQKTTTVEIVSSIANQDNLKSIIEAKTNENKKKWGTEGVLLNIHEFF